MKTPLQPAGLLYVPARTGDGEGHHYRVVDVDDMAEVAYLILLPRIEAIRYDQWPAPRTLGSLENDLFRGRLVLEDPRNDSWAALKAIPESQISELYRNRRDHRWTAIKPLATSRSSELYFRGSRWVAINQCAEKTGASPATIARYLKIYYVHGMTPNALLPDYERCGARGKERPAKHPKAPKPGVRRALANGTGATGVALTPSIRAKIVEGFELYYLGQNEDQDGRVSKVTPVRSLQQAYDLTRTQIFRAESKRDKDGNLPSANDIPTFNQFRYLARTHCARNGINVLKARTEAREWELKHRPAPGSERVGLNGPGDVYAIDYTLADIYLIDEDSRERVVGRPVLYSVMDLWSSRFVAVFASLRYGWDALAVALRIAFGEKTGLLDELGVEYSEDDLIRGVPNQLTGDRGELISRDTNNMVTALNLVVNNTPSYRADIKGIEERGFRVLQECDLRWQPGATYPKRRRGGKDYRRDATMTVTDFNRHAWEMALHHNRAHRIDDSNQLPRDIPLPKHAPTANELWKLGTTRLNGDLRLYSQEVINAGLLRSGAARIHRRGIYYEGLYYAPAALFNEDGTPSYDMDSHEFADWFERNTGRRTPKTLDIGFDPSNVARLIVRLDKGRRIIPCRLTQGSERFSGLSLEEVQDYRVASRMATQLLENEDLNEKQRHHGAITQIVTQAMEDTRDKRGNGHADITGIRESRHEERRNHPNGGLKSIQGGPQPEPEPDEELDADEGYDLTEELRQQRQHTGQGCEEEGD